MADFGFLKELQFNPLSEADLNDKIQLALSDQNRQERIENLKLTYSWQKAKIDFVQALNDFETSKK